MKNKSIISKLKIFVLTLLAPALFLLPECALAWSSFTHGAVSAEALSAYPYLMPLSVYSSIIPDITTNFISPASKDRFYSVFHGEKFRSAVSGIIKTFDKKNEKASIASAYGYLSHVSADEAAHTPEGYPNAKATFAVKTELNHYVAYLFLDMICYYNYFHGSNASFGKFIVDADYKMISKALDEYSKTSGEKISISKADLLKKLAAYEASTAIQKAIFDIIIDDNPELFEQIRQFYGDYYLGVAGRGGFSDAIAAARDNISFAGAPKKNDGSALKDFLSRQKSDIIYAGMLVVSEIAKDTEFIRTGKLTSASIESLVTKFFQSRSESSKSMGKFLSALLLKKGLTFEEIIAYVDGRAVADNDKKFMEYKKDYAELKKDRWYSFIPGTGFDTRKRYVESFVELNGERFEKTVNSSKVTPEVKTSLLKLNKKRLENFRAAELASAFNPFEKAAKRAANDASFATANFAANYDIAMAAAVEKNDGAEIKRLQKRADSFISSMNAQAEKYSKMTLFDKIKSPLAASYRKAFAANARSGLLELKAAISDPAGAAKTPAETGFVQTPGLSENSLELSAGDNDIRKYGLKAPSGSAEAYSLMKAAYENYINFIQSSDESDPKYRDELDRKLKTYVFYKTSYEKLSSGDKAGNGSAQ